MLCRAFPQHSIAKLVKAQCQPRKEGKEQDKFSSREVYPVGLEPMGFLINLGRA
jgi:hypothetical protein